MPIELKRLRGLAKEDESDDEKEKKKQPEMMDWKTPEDRRNAFRQARDMKTSIDYWLQVLEDKGVKSTMKWEEALKMIQDISLRCCNGFVFSVQMMRVCIYLFI